MKNQNLYKGVTPNSLTKPKFMLSWLAFICLWSVTEFKKTYKNLKA